ncbi:MAG: flagellin [Alphaproteobacteria bacterium]|nr:flagellin [Alphaproteobacteria bacterium]
MPTNTISNLGLQLLTTSNLVSQQSNLATLAQQLATGKKHTNLTDYDPTAARNLMDFQNVISQRRSYIDAMKTVNVRLDIYDQTMNDMEDIAAQASSLAASNQNLDANKVVQLKAQIQAYLKQLTDDFNQQVSGRYVYSGSRYSTPPVADLTTLTGAPNWPFTPTASPTLPNYDSEYDGSTTSAAAFSQDSVTIGNGFTVQYGITSNADAMQRLVAGLQFFNDATDQTDPDDYNTGMIRAANLLSGALSGLQSLHAGVANNINILKRQADIQTTAITALQNQITDLQQVDLTEIGTKINLLQTQLQASYSATASLQRLSILNYL